MVSERITLQIVDIEPVLLFHHRATVAPIFFERWVSYNFGDTYWGRYEYFKTMRRKKYIELIRLSGYPKKGDVKWLQIHEIKTP